MGSLVGNTHFVCIQLSSGLDSAFCLVPFRSLRNGDSAVRLLTLFHSHLRSQSHSHAGRAHAPECQPAPWSYSRNRALFHLVQPTSSTATAVQQPSGEHLTDSPSMGSATPSGCGDQVQAASASAAPISGCLGGYQPQAQP